MDPLLLRVFPRLLGGLVIAFGLFFLVLDPKIGETVSRNVEQSVGAGLHVIAHSIAEERRRDPGIEPPTLAIIAESFDAAAKLGPRSSVTLTAEETARLDRGETVATGPRFSWTFLTPLPGMNELLIVGPARVTHPFGGARGLSVAAILIIGLSFGAYFLVSPIKRRLNELSKTAEQLGRGVLSVRTSDRSRDAIGRLARTFNQMAAEIQRLIGAQRELLRTVSHEVRTPIQRVHFALELAREARDEEGRERGYERAERALEDLDRLVEELLTYARLEDSAAPARKPADVAALVKNVLETLAEIRGAKELELRRGSGEPQELAVDPKLIERAISNLIRNALRHARARVEVSIHREGSVLAIDVEDDGPGVPLPDRMRIFEPFQRVVRDGEEKSGFGLGLAIVRRVAEAHAGSVEVRDSKLGGAHFRLLLSRSSN